MTRQHQISYYGHLMDRTEFCRICGVEGPELLYLECVSSNEPDALEEKLKNIWRNVDTIKRIA